MEEEFLKSRYLNKFGIETIIPDQVDREIVHNIIYTELVKGIISQESKQKYLAIVEKLIKNGAEGIISGCTEIEQLIKPNDIKVDLFESTKIHANKAVEFALNI